MRRMENVRPDLGSCEARTLGQDGEIGNGGKSNIIIFHHVNPLSS